MVENKGSILISYLSQIILIIILLQVTGFLKGLTILVLLFTELLIIQSLRKENKWEFHDWYALFIFIITLLFILSQLLGGRSEITPTLSVELIVGLILGFFLTLFSPEKDEEEDVPPVKVVDMEPSIEIIHEEPAEEAIAIKPPETRSRETAGAPKPKVLSEKVENKPKPVGNELIVAIDDGTKYHLPKCRIMNKADKSKVLVFTSKKQAANKGFKKCKICF